MNVSIQSLRAIAVLMVVAFHYFPGRLPFGFLGVDIFFVISGFLIYSLSSRFMRDGRFQFFPFLKRRITRLMPQFTAVAIITMLLGIFFLMPQQLGELARDMIFASTGLYNISSVFEESYFAVGKYEKPLLMMWSLSMEIQFYLLVSFIFLIFGTKKRPHFLSVFLSFIYFVSYPDVNSSALFYDPLARYWQFGFGVLTAMLVINYFDLLKKQPNRILIEVLGGLLVVFGLILTDPHAASPSMPAILVVLGTSILLISTQLSGLTVIGISRVLKFLGDHSYGWYLFHWPFLCFFYLISYQMPGFIGKVFLIAISLFVAVLAYRYIEVPYLRKDRQ